MTTFANTAGYSTTFDALSPENSNPSYFSSENMADYRPFSQAGGGKRRRKRKRKRNKGQTQKASRGRQTVIAKNMCSCMDMLGSTEDVECTLICKSGSKTKTRTLRFKGSRGSAVVRSLLKKSKKKTTKKKRKKRKKSKKAKMRKYLGPADAMALDAVSAVGAEAGKQLGDTLSQGVSKATSYMPEIPKGPRFPKFGPPSDFEPHKLGSAELDVPDGDKAPDEPSPMAEPTDDSPFEMDSKISDDYVDVKPPSGEEPSM
jgi:hypothetical protein